MRGFGHWIASRTPFVVAAAAFLVIAFLLISRVEGQFRDHTLWWSSVQINRWIIVLLLAGGAGAIGASLVKKASGQIGIVACILLLSLATIALMLVAPSGWIVVVGFLLNIGVIWAFLAVRSVVRRRRLEVVVYLADFLSEAVDEAGRPIETASLRLALEKYLLESDVADVTFKQHFDLRFELQKKVNELRRLDVNDPQIAILIEEIRISELRRLLERANDLITTSHRLVPSVTAFFAWLPSYLPFTLISAFFFASFTPEARQLLAPIGICTDCSATVPWGVFWQVGQSGIHLPAPMIIATFAFAGAYVHALNEFVRGVVSYDLGPTSFLRAFRHVAAAVVVSVVTWYGAQSVQITFPAIGERMEQTLPEKAADDQSTVTAVQQPGGNLDHQPAARPAAAPNSSPERSGDAVASNATAAARELSRTPLAFLVLAFVIGLFPDLGIAELVRRSRVQGLKRRGERLLEQVESTPLELLDGVDYNIRLRLEEFGIIDVQNLATANPILLFAETPMFGLYQAIDWIAQAQLCLALGPDTYIKLRDWRIRTIFDLERALHDPETPDILKGAVGAAMLEGSAQTTRVSQALNLTGTAPDIEVAKALGRIIMDDLHVRRLRQIWKIVRDRLGGKWTETMYPE